MLNEPTTIASVARLIGDTLKSDYDVDPEPLYREQRIDTTKFFRTRRDLVGGPAMTYSESTV